MGNPTKKELEAKIIEYQKIISEKNKEIELADQKINELLANADKAFMDSPYYKQLMRDLEIMTEMNKSAEHRLEYSHQREKNLHDRIQQLEQALEQAAAPPKHNERNAGRKKADEKWTASYLRWQELYESQKTINETLEEMGISRATYFRYKRLYQSNKEQ